MSSSDYKNVNLPTTLNFHFSSASSSVASSTPFQITSSLSFRSFSILPLLTTAPTGRNLANVARPAGERILFADEKIKSLKLPLAAADGFDLSTQQLRDVFGIRHEAIGRVPARLMIPNLEASWIDDYLYRVSGKFYIVEPIEWCAPYPPWYHCSCLYLQEAEYQGRDSRSRV